jgi:hypothetical protein
MQEHLGGASPPVMWWGRDKTTKRFLSFHAEGAQTHKTLAPNFTVTMASLTGRIPGSQEWTSVRESEY